MIHRITVLLGTLFAVTAFAAAREPEPPRIYKTPQAAFDALMAAVKKNDFRVALETLSPEAQTEKATHLAIVWSEERKRIGNSAKDGDKGKPDAERKKRFQPVFAVLDRHGITEQATATMDFSYRPSSELLKSRAGMSKLIKKPGQFVQEMLRVVKKVDPDAFDPGKRPEYKLADVKIDGDKASGIFTYFVEDKEKKAGKVEYRGSVKFVKVNGGWRIANQI